MYNLTLRRVRATIVVMEQQRVLHNMTVCDFVVVGIQHAMCMRHTIISGLPSYRTFFHITS
jgi:hypothetical protein